LLEKEIRVDTPDGQMRVFTVHPDTGGPFPVALLYMDGVGYREQVLENARRFAAAGYYCLAPDLFHRLGEGFKIEFPRPGDPPNPEAQQRMMEVIRSIKPDAVMADTRAALAAIEDDPAAAPGPRVCVGYCMGARMALRAGAALSDEMVAVAGIHPGALVDDTPDSPHHDLAGVRGEAYFAFAEIDRTATPELVDRFREEMAKAGVRGTVERLPGVTHGFAMADLPVYDRDAAEHHFDQTLALWRRNLPSPPAT
jgi:carboxymethylenebutenolidase